MNKSDIQIKPTSLTSLRFFAILLVVLHHLDVLILWSPKTGVGGPGVIFFFVLSGFLITLRYRNITARNTFVFFWNRLLRIYPLHLVTFVASVAIPIMYYQPIAFPHAVINLLLIQSFFSAEQIYFSYNSVAWALSTLVFCYVIFALIMMQPKRNFFIAVLISLILLSYSMVYIQVHEEYLAWLINIFPPNRILNFLLGMGTSFCLMRFYGQFKKRLGLLSATVLEVICLCLMLERVFFMGLRFFIAKSFIFIAPSFFKSALASTDVYFTTALISAGIIFIFSLEKGLLSRFLTQRLFVLLGEISFSVYMVHQLFFRFLALWREPLIRAFGSVYLALGACLVVIPISYLLYRFIENPIRSRYKKDFVGEK
jgi:peptidoglycan/LPS O-acetylase OafA/YrhL